MLLNKNKTTGLVKFNLKWVKYTKDRNKTSKSRQIQSQKDVHKTSNFENDFENIKLSMLEKYHFEFPSEEFYLSKCQCFLFSHSDIYKSWIS